MRAGRLPYRAWIQASTRSLDSVGEDTGAFADETEVWMGFTPNDGREFFTGDIRIAEVTHRASMRYRTGVTTKKRIRWGTRVFDIKAVMDITESHRELQLLLLERP